MASTGGAPRLELVWPKKEEFLLSAKDATGKPVWVPKTHPAASEVRLVNFGDTCGHVGPHSGRARDNLVFTGDSLDVLRILAEHPEFRRHYRSQVKCVYIDPPFNTGQAFKHYDDWMEHSTWLSFMRDRLLLIKELLTADGTVWVHLDDTEQHRMRCLLDEVFGSQNFIATVVWQKIHARNNSAQHFSADHDFILVYGRDARQWRPNRVARTAKSDADFWNPDDDPRGRWRRSDLTASKPYTDGHYQVVGPHGDVFSPRQGRPWGTSQENFETLRNDNRLWWGKTGRTFPFRKRFESELGGLVPNTVWLHEEVGNNREAKGEIAAVFGRQDSFSTPKPERLIERVLHIASNAGDLVLDCFGGSGTTAAVAHKMGRRWAISEIVPATVRDFIEPRLRMVVGGSDQGGVSAALRWAGGGGFRSVQVASSSYDVMSDGMVLLSAGATNGIFAQAMAAQLDFDFDVAGIPFCGRRGRMRLAVLDGVVGPEEVRTFATALGEDERVTIVAKVVLPGAEEMLRSLSKGSRIRKAPRDVLADGSRKARRRETAAP